MLHVMGDNEPHGEPGIVIVEWPDLDRERPRESQPGPDRAPHDAALARPRPRARSTRARRRSGAASRDGDPEPAGDWSRTAPSCATLAIASPPAPALGSEQARTQLRILPLTVYVSAPD